MSERVATWCKKESEMGTMPAVIKLPTSIKEEGHLGPRYQMTAPPAKKKQKKSMGIRRLNNGAPLLTLKRWQKFS